MIFDQMVRKGEKTSPVNCICNNYVYEKTTVAQGRDKKRARISRRMLSKT